MYASYQNFSIWVRPLPNITAVEDKLENNAGKANNLKIYPNPVKGFSTISYTLQSPASTSLKVYDILGKERKVLVRENQVAGKHKIVWNTDKLEIGIYLLVLKVGNKMSKQRIIITD